MTRLSAHTADFAQHQETRSVFRKGRKIGELVRGLCSFLPGNAPRWRVSWFSGSARDREELDLQLRLLNQETRVK